MQFLKTLFWVAVAVFAVLFASRNWNPVTLNLWGGLQADVKLPVLVFAAFLLGLLPMFLIHRARVWALRRRLEPVERNAALAASVAPAPPAPVPVPIPASEPAPTAAGTDRTATDTKIWP